MTKHTIQSARKDEPTQNAECLDWHPAFFWGLIQKKHWDNTMSKIIVVVALSCAVATSVFELKLRSVEGDEMSEYHYLKAKSYVFDSMILVLPLLFCFNSLYDTFSGEPFFYERGRLVAYVHRISWVFTDNTVFGIAK